MSYLFCHCYVSETGKSIGYSLVRTPGAYYPISKIKPLSTNPKERESKGVLQTPLGSVDDFDKLSAFEVCWLVPRYVAMSSLRNI